jgi:hypothetical protein
MSQFFGGVFYKKINQIKDNSYETIIFIIKYHQRTIFTI